MAAKFVVDGQANDPVWLIVTHGAAGVHSEADGEYGRRRLSEEFSDLFRGGLSLAAPKGRPRLDHRTDKIVITGDFNCEPSDRVFRLGNEEAWKVSPDPVAVTTARPTWARFYNPMLKADGVFGTFKLDPYGLANRLLDHLLFSSQLCGTTGLRFRPGSVVISEAITGGSDHAAIAASLDY